MNDFKVQRYTSNYKELWDEFVSKSKNATFLFYRGYMDYHNDRFEDFSLIVLKNNKIQALLPANIENNIVYSHKGLTYGGLILNLRNKVIETENILTAVLKFLYSKQVSEINIKLIPSFYNKLMTHDLDYFIFKNGGVLSDRKMNLAIDLKSAYKISKSKLKSYRKVSNTNIAYKHDLHFDDFWNFVLVPRLKEKHNASPVHSLEEINLLSKKFPNNIHQYSVYENNEIIAGITLFETENCVKSQYGATTKKGESLRALDFLFIHLIQEYHNKGKLFFDMGTVNDKENYNKGLLTQKQELGCSVYNQDLYKINLSKYQLTNSL